MAHLLIQSTNPALSFVLFKNPATQKQHAAPFSKPYRKGVVRGWFGRDERSFALHFQDADNECSFATGRASEFEYLDQTRYASPYAPVAMIDTLLRSAVREQHPEDRPGYRNSVKVAAIRLSRHGAAFSVARHFSDFDIELTPMTGRLASLTISAERPLFEVLNLLLVFCILQSIADREIYVELTRESLAKYIRSLNAVRAPYFVRYMFSRDAINSFDDFRVLQPELQLPGAVMNFGDTQKHRFQAIKPFFPGGAHFVDIGCGEGSYVRGFASKYETVIAYEQDDELRVRTQRALAGKGIRNVDWRSEFIVEEAIPDGAHVLMTEVLEHMPLKQSASLLNHLAKQSAACMVFTVPNRLFNPNYAIEEGDFRHDDHDWEPDPTEFQQFMTENLPGWQLEFSGVGDSVASVTSSLMCVARRQVP